VCFFLVAGIFSNLLQRSLFAAFLAFVLFCAVLCCTRTLARHRYPEGDKKKKDCLTWVFPLFQRLASLALLDFSTLNTLSPI
jgi:hypothetical protein